MQVLPHFVLLLLLLHTSCMAAAADSLQPGYSAAPSSCTTAVVRGTPASIAVCQTQSVAMEWLPPAEGFQCWPHILVVATCLTAKATPHSGRSVTAVGTVGCRSDNQGHLGAPRLSVVGLCQHGSCKHHNPHMSESMSVDLCLDLCLCDSTVLWGGCKSTRHSPESCSATAVPPVCSKGMGGGVHIPAVYAVTLAFERSGPERLDVTS